MSELEPVTTTITDGDDPFEEFNQATGAGAIRNPYPAFAALRKQGSIVKIDLRAMVGSGGGMMRNAPTELYMATTHEAVSHVLRDCATFSSSGYEQIMGVVMGHSILEMDEP